VMNQVLNALLNLESVLTASSATAGEAEPAFTRVIEPSEHLSSLGSFWQSLGDKPRLCLNLAITVPVKLTSPDEEISPVSKLELIAGAAGVPSLEQVPSRFIMLLIERLKPIAGLARVQLEKLIVMCEWNDVEKAGNRNKITVELIGKLESSVYDRVVRELTDTYWNQGDLPLGYLVSFNRMKLCSGAAISVRTSETGHSI